MNIIKYFLLFILSGVPAFAAAGVYEDMLHAIQNDDESTVASLLQRGVDVDTVSPEGESLLMLAVKAGKPNVINRIVAAKPRINVHSAFGETALMLAALKGNTETVKLLLEKGASINHPGWTPLMYSALNNRLDIARLLIGRGAQVNSTADNGTTALMMAAREGHLQMVLLLLEHNADVNHRTQFGYTALSVAQDRNMHEVAKMLIKAGAE
jgi:ankyrin repeat protein